MSMFSAAVFAAALVASPATAVPPALALLKDGGYVVLMRHANSPSGQIGSVGLTEGCELQPGRGLDAAGFYQARAIGGYLQREGVPIGQGFASSYCRTWDTARLVAAGAPVAAEEALRSTDPLLTAAFKNKALALVRAATATNLLVVTHSNVVPLYSDYDEAVEIPSGLVLVVDPAGWTVKACLNFTKPLANEPAPDGVCAEGESR